MVSRAYAPSHGPLQQLPCCICTCKSSGVRACPDKDGVLLPLLLPRSVPSLDVLDSHAVTDVERERARRLTTCVGACTAIAPVAPAHDATHACNARSQEAPPAISRGRRGGSSSSQRRRRRCGRAGAAAAHARRDAGA